MESIQGGTIDSDLPQKFKNQGKIERDVRTIEEKQKPRSMGVRGLDSSLKQYAIEIQPKEEEPLHIGIDTYALLYKFKENLDALFRFVTELQSEKHTVIFVLDGVPPPEKQEELANRKAQRTLAANQAKALKDFLLDSSAQELTEDARDILQKKIHAYENEAWVVYKDLRDRFTTAALSKGYKVLLSKGEADTDLLRMALDGSVQVILANDMDYFVGGAERLWIVNKEFSSPKEFRRTSISNTLGIPPSAWRDIAILAGYEKTPHLRRVPTATAISYLRFYGTLETLFARRPELLGGHPVEEFQAARRFFE